MGKWRCKSSSESIYGNGAAPSLLLPPPPPRNCKTVSEMSAGCSSGASSSAACAATATAGAAAPEAGPATQGSAASLLDGVYRQVMWVGDVGLPHVAGGQWETMTTWPSQAVGGFLR